MKCEHCGGSGAVPVVYVDKRKRHAGQLALARVINAGRIDCGALATLRSARA